MSCVTHTFSLSSHLFPTSIGFTLYFTVVGSPKSKFMVNIIILRVTNRGQTKASYYYMKAAQKQHGKKGEKHKEGEVKICERKFTVETVIPALLLT